MGGGIFEQHEFFSLMFPLNEYFFVKMLCTNIFFLEVLTKLKKILNHSVVHLAKGII